MSLEPEGWYMDAGPPWWDAQAKTFSFLLRKAGSWAGDLHPCHGYAGECCSIERPFPVGTEPDI